MKALFWGQRDERMVFEIKEWSLYCLLLGIGKVELKYSGIGKTEFGMGKVSKINHVLHSPRASCPVAKVKVQLLALQDEGADSILCMVVDVAVSWELFPPLVFE